MAGLKFRADLPEVDVLATVKQTIFQLVTRADQGILISEWSVAGKAGGPGDEMFLLEIEMQTSAGAGGADAAASLKLENPRDTVSAIQTTALSAITGGTPTVNRIVMREEIAALGSYTWKCAPGFDEIWIPGGLRVGFAVTSLINNKIKVRANVQE